MREVQDGFDLMLTVITMLLLLTVCIWSITAIKGNSEILVDEKTSIHNVFGHGIEKPVRTAKDALMGLVVNDAYLPSPTTVVFRLGTETCTIVYDNAYFEDKEASINEAWANFFHNKMDATIASTTLDLATNRWIVELVP